MRLTRALFASTFIITASLAGVCLAQETPEPPQMAVEQPKDVSDFTFVSTGTLATGRIFKEQQINLTTEPVAEIDALVTHEPTGLYGYVWVAESLVGRTEDHERDFQFGKDTGIGTATWRAELALFELPGKEVYRLRNRLTYPIAENLTGSTTVDVLRGGLDSEVFMTGASYDTERISISGNLTYDRAFDAAGINGAFGWKPFKDRPVQIVVTGYTGNRDSGAVLKLRIW